MPKTPAEHMRNSADVQESRDIEYGSAYKRHGPAIAPLFPDGVVLSTPADHTRFAILTLLFGKLTRYCGNFERGGHEDSLTDMIAYTAMLKEVDEEEREVQDFKLGPDGMIEERVYEHVTSPESAMRQSQRDLDDLVSRPVTVDKIKSNSMPIGKLSEEALDKLGK